MLVAVAMFLLNGLPLKEYKWMKEEPFETAYGVTGMVRERQKALQSRLMMHIVVGVSLCILALVVLIASDLPDKLIDLPEPLFVAMAFAMAAVAVYLFVSVGLPHGAYQIILQEGDYTSRKKAVARKAEQIIGIYWLLVVAAYLGYSLLTMDWGHSWIILPVAGVLCGVLCIALEWFYTSREEKRK